VLLRSGQCGSGQRFLRAGPAVACAALRDIRSQDTRGRRMAAPVGGSGSGMCVGNLL
jgi:hypothetical protein